MRFVLSGKMNKEKYQGKIEALGGKVKNSVDKDTIALVSDKGKDVHKDLNKKNSNVKIFLFHLVHTFILLQPWITSVLFFGRKSSPGTFCPPQCPP